MSELPEKLKFDGSLWADGIEICKTNTSSEDRLFVEIVKRYNAYAEHCPTPELAKLADFCNCIFSDKHREMDWARIEKQDKQIADQQAEIERLNEIHSQAICAYCRFAINKTTPEETAKKMSEHIRVCKDNPLVKVIAEQQKLIEQLVEDMRAIRVITYSKGMADGVNALTAAAKQKEKE